MPKVRGLLGYVHEVDRVGIVERFDISADEKESSRSNSGGCVESVVGGVAFFFRLKFVDLHLRKEKVISVKV